MKTKKYSTFLFIIIMLGVISSCTNNNEEDLYPNEEPTNGGCETTNMSFQSDIVPILQANCYECHSNANANSKGDGLKLEGYTNFSAWANNGRVEGAIKRLPGYTPMPKSAPKLDECTINKIVAWIDQGAKNN